MLDWSSAQRSTNFGLDAKVFNVIWVISFGGTFEASAIARLIHIAKPMGVATICCPRETGHIRMLITNMYPLKFETPVLNLSDAHHRSPFSCISHLNPRSNDMEHSLVRPVLPRNVTNIPYSPFFSKNGTQFSRPVQMPYP